MVVAQRRIRIGVQVLGLVDMSQGDIIQARVTHQGAGQHQIAAQHNRPLASVFGALDGGVGRKNDRQFRIDPLQPGVNQLRQAFFQRLVNLGWIYTLQIQLGHQAGA